MTDKGFKLLEDLTDNDTLIIMFLFVLAILAKDAQILAMIVGGFVGYLKGRTKNGTTG